MSITDKLPNTITSDMYLFCILNVFRNGMMGYKDNSLHFYWKNILKIRTFSDFFLVFQDQAMPEGHYSGANRHVYKIIKVDRFDDGRYTCTADNQVGRPAKAHIDLKVLCK